MKRLILNNTTEPGSASWRLSPARCQSCHQIKINTYLFKRTLLHSRVGSESVGNCNRLISDPLDIQTAILITVYSHAKRRRLSCMLMNFSYLILYQTLLMEPARGGGVRVRTSRVDPFLKVLKWWRSIKPFSVCAVELIVFVQKWFSSCSCCGHIL